MILVFGFLRVRVTAFRTWRRTRTRGYPRFTAENFDEVVEVRECYAIVSAFVVMILVAFIFIFQILNFAMRCCAVRTQRIFCSASIWFNCFEILSQTEELCLLLMGKYSFHTEISNRTSTSVQFGDLTLLPDSSLISLSPSWLMWRAADCTCGLVERASRWICGQCGKIIGPRWMNWSPSGPDGSTRANLELFRYELGLLRMPWHKNR